MANSIIDFTDRVFTLENNQYNNSLRMTHKRINHLFNKNIKFLN